MLLTAEMNSKGGASNFCQGNLGACCVCLARSSYWVYVLAGIWHRLSGVLVPTAWLYILTWQASPNFWLFLSLPDNLRTQHFRSLGWVLWGWKKKEGKGESWKSCSMPYRPQTDPFPILLGCTLSGAGTACFVLFNGKGNRTEIKL